MGRVHQDLAPTVVMEVLAQPITPLSMTARVEAIEALKMLIWEPLNDEVNAQVLSFY